MPPHTLDEIRRDMARLAVVRGQIEEIEQARLERLEQAPDEGPNAMVRLLARIVGVGVETADMLVQVARFPPRRFQSPVGAGDSAPASGSCRDTHAAAGQDLRAFSG
jgi:transposase